MHTTNSTNVSLVIDQDTNLEEVMAYLQLAKKLVENNIPAPDSPEQDLLGDFSIHEGELAPASPDV